MSANPSGAIHPTRFLVGWGVGTLLLTHFAPLPLPPEPGPLVRIPTLLLTGLGVVGMVWSQWAFWRAGTTTEHSEETQELVTTGPFRLSRNPIYISLVALMVGIGLHYGTLWAVLLAVPVAWAVRRWTVEPEEDYLEERFGDEYRAYRSRVRRWL